MVIAAAVILIVFIWSAFLIGYREDEKELHSDESKVFDPRCRSIEIERGNDRAVLFIHGFPTTPDMYRYSAGIASEAGYDVFAPLIPSFGADYRDFAKTNFSSWYRWIEDYFNEKRRNYRYFYVVGVSMGGALTLKLAENNRDITAMAVFSAPVVYNSLIRDRIITNPAGYIARIIALFTPFIAPKCLTGHKGNNDGDDEWIGYGGQFPRQGVSIMHNLKAIRKRLPDIRTPVFLLHDKGDRTVPFANLAIIDREIGSEKKKTMTSSMDRRYRHTHHSLLMYHSCREKNTYDILDFFKEVEDELKAH